MLPKSPGRLLLTPFNQKKGVGRLFLVIGQRYGRKRRCFADPGSPRGRRVQRSRPFGARPWERKMAARLHLESTLRARRRLRTNDDGS